MRGDNLKAKHLGETQYLRIGIVFVVVIILALISFSIGSASTKNPINGMVFHDPFGYMGYSPYRPRIVNINGLLIENTSYGVNNPDLNQPNSCFGVPWAQLWHAGEDEYDNRISPMTTEQGTTAGAEVKAIADGIVKYSNNAYWPGSVVIVEHNTGSIKTYSLYGHLLPSSVTVAVNQFVSQGQTLGVVLFVPYEGYWPQFHESGDDSHLHFEIRFFLDASNIYTQPACNGSILGRGYTYPIHPTEFPELNVVHYTDPTQYIWLNQWHTWVPAINFGEN
jgi:hypothetical protein